MPTRQFLLIGRRYFGQRNANGMSGDSQTPQDVAQLLGQSSLIYFLALKRALPNQAKHLSRFLGEAGARVEQTVAIVERRIQRAQRATLVVIESHGGIAITHS